MTTLKEANVATETVAKTKAPDDTIINNGDLETSATTITIVIPFQSRPINRIILLDTTYFLITEYQRDWQEIDYPDKWTRNKASYYNAKFWEKTEDRERCWTHMKYTNQG